MERGYASGPALSSDMDRWRSGIRSRISLGGELSLWLGGAEPVRTQQVPRRDVPIRLRERPRQPGAACRAAEMPLVRTADANAPERGRHSRPDLAKLPELHPDLPTAHRFTGRTPSALHPERSAVRSHLAALRRAFSDDCLRRHCDRSRALPAAARAGPSLRTVAWAPYSISCRYASS